MTSSCLTAKKVVYFHDLQSDSLYPGPGPVVIDSVTPFVDPRIEPNDVLAITLQTITQSDGNTPITSNTSGTFNSLNGFMVDKNGYIELALIGFVKVAGLTTAEARELIKQKGKEFWKDPVVNVRIANFDIQVLGDVGKAGTVTIPNEKASIVDVIALAGDLNLTARHDNVMLIRTEGDTKKVVRFDMTSSNIFRSPYYYVKQHDVIYVEPGKFKIQNSDNTFIRNLGIFTSVISVVSLLFAFKVIK